MTTLIQCNLGPRETQVGGETYTFANDEHRRAVCPVHNLVHVQCFLSVAHYVVAEPLPIPAAAEISSAETLLGSNLLPSVIQFDADHSATLGEIVAQAHKDSGLTLEGWNALANDEREARLQAVVDAAAASFAAANIERARLAQEVAQAEIDRLAREAADAEETRLAAEQAEQAERDRLAAEELAKQQAAVDPLIDITGIGPSMVKKLADIGITTFAQIAAWDAETAAKLGKELKDSGSIERDDWVGQAKFYLDIAKEEAAKLAANPPQTTE